MSQKLSTRGMFEYIIFKYAVTTNFSLCKLHLKAVFDMFVSDWDKNNNFFAVAAALITQIINNKYYYYRKKFSEVTSLQFFFHLS